MPHSAIRGLPGSAAFSHIISQTARLKKKVAEHKMCVLISSTAFV
jgi:hypothetical protein